MYFSQIHNLADQERLLTKILDMQNIIRQQREKKRLHKEKLTVQYGRLLDPLSKQLRSIAVPTPSKPPPTIHPLIAPVPDPLPSSEIEEEQFIIPDPQEATLPEPTPVEEVIPPTSTQNSHASSDYLDALSSITKSNLDDGILGINHATQLLHGMPFTVTDVNKLNIETPTGLVSLKIPSKEVWQLLLAKNPNKLSIPLYQSNNLPTPALRNYRLIAKKLDLLERTREDYFGNAAHKTAIQRRKKYQLLHTGDGCSSPCKKPYLVGSVKKRESKLLSQAIPSDPEGLMHELRIYASEYRSGNHLALNRLTPMVNQAKRIGIPSSKLAFLKGIPFTHTIL